jgi:glycosyltransferase involved in cell wall biosynthesis
MNILFLPKYNRQAASTRQRVIQFIPYYEQAGHTCRVEPLLGDYYLKAYNAGQPISKLRIIGDYFHRLGIVLDSDQFDLVVIQFELFPYLPNWLERWLRYRQIPFIIDNDDAIFHNYDQHRFGIIRWLWGGKIRSLGLIANHFITGSPYLTTYYQAAGASVTEVPTSINIDEYPTDNDSTPTDPFVIGWIGSHSTSQHLLTVGDALKRFLTDYPAASVRLIGFDKAAYDQIAHPRIKIVNWAVDQDYALLEPITVGVMPLPDDPFSRGKCGFKLIQYMAASKPFIATPLEANVKIDRNSENLFARSTEEWYNALRQVMENRAHYLAVGRRNRQVAATYYSIQVNAALNEAVFQLVTAHHPQLS